MFVTDRNTERQTGYPSVDKPWLKFYDSVHSHDELPNGSMYKYIWDNSKSNLDKTMLSYLGNNISGTSFFKNILRLASSFQNEGLKKGDIVTMMSLVTPETIYCIYALNYLGIIVNSVYLGMSPSEIEETVSKTNSKMLIVLDMVIDRINTIINNLQVDRVLVLSIADSLPFIKKNLYLMKKGKVKNPSSKMISYKHFLKDSEELVKPADVDGNTPAFIVYTSGSTGTPKGVVLSNININSTAFNYLKAGFKHEKTDSYMTFIPLFLSIGISLAMHMPLSMGLKLDICPDPSPEAVTKHFLKVRPNHFCGDPHNAVLIADELTGNCKWIKTLAVGGASPTLEQEMKINAKLSELRSESKLITGYGMTELSATATTTLNQIYKEGSIGIPLPLCSVRITDIDTQEELKYNEEGELLISSPGQTREYFNNPQATSELIYTDENGIKWIRTGDLATIDEDGFVYFRGRLKRIYLKQGEDGTPYKIFPQRVELLLQDTDGVLEAAVIVLEDETVQHIQIAFVKVDRSILTNNIEKTLINKCSENLPNFMVPEKIVVINSIPRLTNGKIDYKELEHNFLCD